MGTVQHIRAPTWKWDNTLEIWYWWDFKNGVKRGLDGTEVESVATPGRVAASAHSPSPPFTTAGTTISGLSDYSIVSTHLLQHHVRLASGFGPSRRLTDKDWKVALEPLKFFLPGQVFSVRRIFAVPSGSTPRERASTQPTQGIHGLVVIKTGILSCSVVPIVAQLATGDIEGHYEVQQHGVVYTTKTAPAISEAEAEMQPYPIKIEPDHGWYTLLPTARIHYGKVHNIEHSAKVLSFGKIAEADKEAFIKQFAEVWSAQLGVSFSIIDPVVETITDMKGNSQGSAIQIVRQNDRESLQVEVPKLSSLGDKSTERSDRIPETSHTQDDEAPIRSPVSTPLPNLEHFPLTQSYAHDPAISTTSDMKPTALDTGVPETLPTVQDSPTERRARKPEVVVINNYDRLYGRLKRFVGLHDSALEQQSVAVQKRHHFERELDAAWESLAQCLQVMDAVKTRVEGLDAAHEELDDAFRKARDRVGSAKSVQKQSAAKRQELSTAESNIRDNTRHMKDLLEWRAAREGLLERMDEMKADIARKSENASAKDIDETLARQRPEVVAFDQAHQRVSMTRMQLQEFEEEHEERRRHHEIALDRGEPGDVKFAEKEQDYEVQKAHLAAALDKDEMNLSARRRECLAAGVLFQDDPSPDDIDVLDSTSGKNLSTLRDEIEDLQASSDRRLDTLAHVDQWVRQLPPSFSA
ncbi:hypothetical protein LTR95_001276 [Oleoguttula sp. CCFEE 5521]